MKTIAKNCRVTISFEGKLDNGELFKTVTEKAPQSFMVGNLELPPTLERELMGLSIGDKKSVRVPPEEGYGARQKMLLHTVSRSNFGDKLDPKPGMILSLKIEKDGKEHQVPATIIEVSPQNVVVDYNHPLAGHHLTYHVTILNIEEA